MAPTSSKIVNDKDMPFSQFLQNEKNFYLMVFGTPADYEKRNVTEKDVRDLMKNTMNISDMTSFEPLLKDFDKKNETEKRAIVVELGGLLVNAVEALTTEELLREYMKKELKVIDFKPYEELLKDFDKKNQNAKKEILKELAKVYTHQLSDNFGKKQKSNFILVFALVLFIFIVHPVPHIS
ncbi:hypothetical protein HHI36_008228 [Cryptolaemus montrouzieri]|uniref:Uncharacterized protein n=1 Tax=Cryptolaemus montrouzieri TaxID=559131 RepID=A0ABD2MRV3_9CUCU